jgi:hypothetical protein
MDRGVAIGAGELTSPSGRELRHLDESHPCECALVDLIPAMLPENNFSLSIARGIRHAVYRESHPPKRP